MTPRLLDLTRSASSLGALRPRPARRRPPVVIENPSDGVRLSDIAGALSSALDITEGQPMGHAVRTTLIGMRIGTQLGLSDADRSARGGRRGRAPCGCRRGAGNPGGRDW